MPFSYRDETKELNEVTRKETGGSFLQLSEGFTHYELSNPQAHSTVVLVHGFSVPYFIYDPTFAFLTQTGFRVLRYDLFGRGFSDRPKTRYNLRLFVRQLRDLLDGLQLNDPVSLVGLSTGGPISAMFTKRFPKRVNKLVLVDPVGAKPLPFARALKLATAPIVGEALLNLISSKQPHKNLVSNFFHREVPETFRSRYIVQMKFKGFRRAILSSIRNGILDPIPDVYERIGKMNKPVLLFWGRQDRTVPFKHSAILQRAMPRLEFHAIEETEHIPHYDKPEEVNPILLRFLSTQTEH
jgi:pimeloyl-ACP methyl ester carboxylesterase